MMRFRCLIVSVFILSTAVSIKAGASSTPAGFVARSNGEVSVIRNGKKSTVQVMGLLYTSDEVDIPAGASVRINLLPGTGYEIRGAARFRITDKPEFVKGKASGRFAIDQKECAAAIEVIVETGDDGGLRSPVKKGERSGVYRMRGRTKGKIILLNTTVLPSRPVFVWNREKTSVRYEVTVKDGDAVLWSGVSERNYLQYPDDAPSLRGKENLIVVMRAIDAGRKVTGSGTNEFELYDQNTDGTFARRESEIRSFSDELTKNLLSARLYESYGLLPLANESYEKAIVAGGEAEILRAKIKTLNDEMDGDR